MKTMQELAQHSRSRGLGMRLLAIGCVASILLVAPMSSNSARAREVNKAVSSWVKVSPSRVSTDARAFNNSNFGFQSVAVAPKSGDVYVGTCYQGIWKSSNGGRSWTKINTGTNGSLLDGGRIWSLVVDRVNPNILYATAGYGAGGVFKSVDGGVNWTNMFPSDSSIAKNVQSVDVYSIAIDPRNDSHILASFHGYFSGGAFAAKSPVLESLDGGNTWTVHTAGSLTYPQYVFFLGNSSTWLLGTTGKGFWRSIDSGHHWAQVSKQSFADGGTQLYRAKNGKWYVGAAGSLLRSSNNGRTWEGVGPPGVVSAYMAVVGDGRQLYVEPVQANPHSYVSAESDGKHWKQLGSQTFGNGPVHMAYDPVHHIVYSANWLAGVWKHQVQALSK